MNNKDMVAPGEGVTSMLTMPTMGDFDTTKYLKDIDEFDLNHAQQVALLEALGTIMLSFVEMGFDVKNCGQILDAFTQAARDGSKGVKCSEHSTSSQSLREEASHD